MQRIGPDARQPLADLRPPQVFQINPERLPIGELGVVFALPGEVGIGPDHMADIAHQDERRPAMRHRQCPRIPLGLPPGVQHQHVPGAAGVPHAALRRLKPRQVLHPQRLRSTRLPRLLGFQHEAAALIKVDPPEPMRAVNRLALHRALEHIVVVLGAGRRRIGPGDAEHVAQLGQEQRIIGPFLATLLPLPASNERIYLRCPTRHVR
jgi:hypothetical protein